MAVMQHEEEQAAQNMEQEEKPKAATRMNDVLIRTGGKPAGSPDAADALEAGDADMPEEYSLDFDMDGSSESTGDPKGGESWEDKKKREHIERLEKDF